MQKPRTTSPVMYALGEGVPENDTEAVKWFRKAAEQGYADAQYYLGDVYYFGEGVPLDEVWFSRQSCGQQVSIGDDQIGEEVRIRNRIQFRVVDRDPASIQTSLCQQAPRMRGFLSVWLDPVDLRGGGTEAVGTLQLLVIGMHILVSQ